MQFPVRGNYKLVCLVHVLEPAALPFSQSEYDELAAQEKTKLLADADNDQKETSAHHHFANAVRARTGEVVATAGGKDSLSVMRFLNDTLVIHAGETAEWTNQDPITPHTITFGIEPASPMPPSANVTIDADGALHATITSVFDSSVSTCAGESFLRSASRNRTGRDRSCRPSPRVPCHRGRCARHA